MDVPAFRMYFPTVKFMSRRQRDFYESLERQLDAGEAPSVKGYITYLFLYVYKVIGDAAAVGHQATYARLLELADVYAHETKFASHCRHWAYDCLLASEEYQAFCTGVLPEGAQVRRRTGWSMKPL